MALVLVERYGWAAILFGAAALTDFLDGYLARRWSRTSTLGSFLDTTADKLLVTGALLALMAVDRASPWVTFIIVSREFAIMALRGLAAVDQVVVTTSIWGKLKANVQFVAVVLAMLRVPFQWGGLHPDEWAMWLAATVTLASGLEYLFRFWPVLRAADRATEEPGR